MARRQFRPYVISAPFLPAPHLPSIPFTFNPYTYHLFSIKHGPVDTEEQDWWRLCYRDVSSFYFFAVGIGEIQKGSTEYKPPSSFTKMGTYRWNWIFHDTVLLVAVLLDWRFMVKGSYSRKSGIWGTGRITQLYGVKDDMVWVERKT